MLASYARCILLAESLFWTTIAVALSGAGWDRFAAIAVAASLPIVLRAGLTLNTFRASSALAVRADAPRLSPVLRLRLITQEVWWTAVTFSVLLPFPRLAGAMDAVRPCHQPPVLLVHGYLCNHGIWRAMKRFLENHGIGAWSHDLEPPFASIDDYAQQLSARIDTVLTTTGASRIVIIGHSMGGLVLRAYLRAYGGTRIALGITLGTPHHGTRIARSGIGENARQMVPGSAWLTELERSESGGLAAPVLSIGSPRDNVISPQDSVRLETAKNVTIDGLGHVSLPFSRRIQSLVLEAIRALAAHPPANAARHPGTEQATGRVA